MTDTRPERLDSVDLLRGIAMVLMALDHVRDFFHASRIDPLDLAQTTPILFLTRWITHHCAPAFVFLAGTGAFLSLARGRTLPQLSRFLLTRGLWLVFLELTVVRFGWLFNLDYTLTIGQVIWAIGWSMVAMAGLVFLPRWSLAAVSLGMIVFHNAFDGLEAGAFGPLAWLWEVLHVQSAVNYAPGSTFLVAYPLIPWIGVLGAGYLFGPLLLQEEARRRRSLWRLGGALIAAFAVLRAANLYGDPDPWTHHSDPLTTLLSFINTTKYPPSLLYLLMTLGPAIAALPLLERWKGGAARFVTVFGRVPLFYYVVHLLLIHGLAILAALLTVGDAGFLVTNAIPGSWPNAYGFGLGTVYLVWIAVVGVLYFPCRWFAGLKRRRKDPWLSYL